jgi:hypothetical protein
MAAGVAEKVVMASTTASAAMDDGACCGGLGWQHQQLAGSGQLS